MVTRDFDRKLGMIVAVQEPHWADGPGGAKGWSFEILIDDTLIYTEAFGWQFSLVKTW
jgi:hypothetical protein